MKNLILEILDGVFLFTIITAMLILMGFLLGGIIIMLDWLVPYYHAWAGVTYG